MSLHKFCKATRSVEEAWPFYRTISGVRLYWVLEEPKGPNEPKGPKGLNPLGPFWCFGALY